jgi:hypothetical protein
VGGRLTTALNDFGVGEYGCEWYRDGCEWCRYWHSSCGQRERVFELAIGRASVDMIGHSGAGLGSNGAAVDSGYAVGPTVSESVS